MTAPRYAIYYAPAADSPWWRFGAHWLGWDEQRGLALRQPDVPGLGDGGLHGITRHPRRYGFHATLKAPFRLRDGVPETLLRSRLAAVAADLRRLPLGRLEPQLLDGFVALVPTPRQPGVDSLAAKCMLELDDLRAPLTPAEFARRRPELLDDVERALLQRYGYPHVLGRYRFHMTLSDAVDPQLGELLLARARDAVAPLNTGAPPLLDRVCLFREDHPGAPFQRIHDEELAP